MLRYLVTWLGLLLFVVGTTLWLFPSMPALPDGMVFEPHLVIPTYFSLMLVSGGIVLMLLTRNQDDQLHR